MEGDNKYKLITTTYIGGQQFKKGLIGSLDRAVGTWNRDKIESYILLKEHPDIKFPLHLMREVKSE